MNRNPFESMINWFARNAVAANLLMLLILAFGIVSAISIRKQTTPDFELNNINVRVPYLGAAPQEVEEGIGQKIEEAVQSIDGIKKMTSVAAEGAGSVILELSATVKDVQRVVNEVRSAVDRIPSFPDLAEDPEVQQLTFREAAINVSVVAPVRSDGEVDVAIAKLGTGTVELYAGDGTGGVEGGCGCRGWGGWWCRIIRTT